MAKDNLPEHLTRSEEGHYKPHSWSSHPADKVWVCTGWKITHEDELHFRSSDRDTVEGWLSDNGYITRDFVHYHRLRHI